MALATSSVRAIREAGNQPELVRALVEHKCALRAISRVLNIPLTNVQRYATSTSPDPQARGRPTVLTPDESKELEKSILQAQCDRDCKTYYEIQRDVRYNFTVAFCYSVCRKSIAARDAVGLFRSSQRLFPIESTATAAIRVVAFLSDFASSWQPPQLFYCSYSSNININ